MTTPPHTWDYLGPAIGAKVSELREVRGLSQEALADAIHVSVYALARLEAGNRPDLPVSLLARLARALRCKPATLLPERLPAPRRARS